MSLPLTSHCVARRLHGSWPTLVNQLRKAGERERALGFTSRWPMTASFPPTRLFSKVGQEAHLTQICVRTTCHLIYQFPLMVQNRNVSPSREGEKQRSGTSHLRSQHMGCDGKKWEVTCHLLATDFSRRSFYT